MRRLISFVRTGAAIRARLARSVRRPISLVRTGTAIRARMVNRAFFPTAAYQSGQDQPGQGCPLVFHLSSYAELRLAQFLHNTLMPPAGRHETHSASGAQHSWRTSFYLWAKRRVGFHE